MGAAHFGGQLFFYQNLISDTLAQNDYFICKAEE
jgi:hypothetical protein